MKTRRHIAVVLVLALMVLCAVPATASVTRNDLDKLYAAYQETWKNAEDTAEAKTDVVGRAEKLMLQHINDLVGAKSKSIKAAAKEEDAVTALTLLVSETLDAKAEAEDKETAWVVAAEQFQYDAEADEAAAKLAELAEVAPLYLQLRETAVALDDGRTIRDEINATEYIAMLDEGLLAAVAESEEPTAAIANAEFEMHYVIAILLLNGNAHMPAAQKPTAKPTAKPTPKPAAQPAPQPAPESVPEPAPQPTPEPKPEHTHSWVDVTEQVTTAEQGHWEKIEHPAGTSQKQQWVETKAAWDETKTVVDKPAWDETIVVTDKAAWDETITVIDQEAWREEHWVIICHGPIGELTCFMEFDDFLAWNEHCVKAAHSSSGNKCYYTDHPAVTHTETVHHDAVTHTETVHHDAVTHTETVHHDAEGYWETVTVTESKAWTEDKWIVDSPAKTETAVTGQKCSACGATK